MGSVDFLAGQQLQISGEIVLWTNANKLRDERGWIDVVAATGERIFRLSLAMNAGDWRIVELEITAEF